MNIRRLLLSAIALSLLTTAARAQSFPAGDIIVQRMGDGSAALGSTATAIFLDVYNPTSPATPVQTIALPTTGNNTSGNFAVTSSGSAVSEGFITLSPNGQYLAFSGYSANVGLAGIASQTSANVSRDVGTLSYNGTLNIVSMGSTAFNANNIRSAFTNNTGTNIWAVGAGGSSGNVWSTNSGTPTQISSSNSTNKSINAAGGQLFASNGTNILAIGTGAPTSGSSLATTNLSPNIVSSNVTQFFFADLSNTIVGPDTLYIANAASNTTSILKFTLTSGNLVGGTWVATGTAGIGSIGNGTSTGGAFGLTGEADSHGNVTIYGTTPGAIFDLVDTSGYDGTLSGTASSLVTVSTNEAFRGIAFAPSAPVPEPGETAALIGAGALLLAAWRRRRGKIEPPAPPTDNLA